MLNIFFTEFYKHLLNKDCEHANFNSDYILFLIKDIYDKLHLIFSSLCQLIMKKRKTLLFRIIFLWMFQLIHSLVIFKIFFTWTLKTTSLNDDIEGHCELRWFKALLSELSFVSLLINSPWTEKQKIQSILSCSQCDIIEWFFSICRIKEKTKNICSSLSND